MTKAEQNGMVGYLGHDPELFNDSVRNNILLGDDDDPEKYLKAVCFDGEVAEMYGHRWWCPALRTGAETGTGEYLKAVCFDWMILSALDRKTEEEVMVGQHCDLLSGSPMRQAQRLALARTLCHKRPVLILD